MSRLYPECRHPRAKGDQHRRCIECLGREHAEAALLEEEDPCRICSSFPLARLRKRLSHWTAQDPADADPVPHVALAACEDGLELPAGQPAPPSPPASLPRSASPPPLRLPRGYPEAAEDAVIFGYASDDLESLPDPDDSASVAVSCRSTPAEPLAGHRLLTAELRDLATRAAAKLGIPAAVPPAPVASLLDGAFFSAPPPPGPAPIPLFPDVHRELTRFWGCPFSARSPVRGFDAFMEVDQALDLGYLAFPPVEDAVAGYLNPASPTLRLGKKPALPTRAGKQQAAVAEKAYLAAGQAACAINTQALLTRYQAQLLAELDGSALCPDLLTELRKAADISLRLTRCAAQAVGRNMAALVVLSRCQWLSLSRLSDAEKGPLLDAPISPRGVFGGTVALMASKFEADKKDREALQACIPRSLWQQQSRQFVRPEATKQPFKRASGSPSPARPPKSQPKGWTRHPFRPPQPTQPQQPSQPPQPARRHSRQHSRPRRGGPEREQQS